MTGGTATIAHRAQEFATKYRSATSEKQLGQSFWRDFFQDVLHVPDLTSAGIEFEVPVRSSMGNIQWIDCLWEGTVLIEQKSAGKDLDQAEQQARDYLQSLTPAKRPPSIIVCNFQYVRIIEVIQGTSYEFPLEELPANMDRVLSVVSFRGEGAATPRVEADKQAVQLMGELYTAFENANYQGHQLSVFLIRILFLNFGDDTGMWKYTPGGLFGSYITNTYEDGTGVGARIEELFQVLNTPASDRSGTLSPVLADFPYINGGLFSEQLPIFAFNAEMRTALISTTEYDWSNISPAIFGAMFQTVKDRELRRESGEFFTNEKSILRVISPLFLDNLTTRLEAAWDSKTKLRTLWADIGKMNFLDPAAGSGNFLLVSYKKLRELELKIIARINELEGRDIDIQLIGNMGLKVHLQQFHGIEHNEWSAQIAYVAMFLADHQANREMDAILGYSPERFPLTESAVIHHGNALHIAWEDICPMDHNTYILGNPPFNGSTLMLPEQRADTTLVWNNSRGSGSVDYVTNWFLIAAQYAHSHHVHTAFVATSSITEGEQPPVLWKALYALDIAIDFAYQTFNWDAGAGVHVVIIGFSTTHSTKKKPLWIFDRYEGEPFLTHATNINAYLVDAPNILVESRRRPLIAGTQPLDYGSKPTDGGWLSKISPAEARIIEETDPIAAKYLRRLIGAKELTSGDLRYCLWLVNADPHDLATSPELSRRIKAVRDFRLESTKQSTREAANRPHEFQEIRQPTDNYLVVPRHTTANRDYVPIGRFPHTVITNDAVSLVNDGSLITFGFLMSKAFNIWTMCVSGKLRQHPRISGSITYNNFPFPTLTDHTRSRIEQASQAILDARDQFPDTNLTTLYDPLTMPTALRAAHTDLDKAVGSALHISPRARDEQILAALFTKYQETLSGLLPTR